MSNSKNEIYIDCQPVDSDGQTLVKVHGNTDTSAKFSEIIKHPFIGVIVGFIFFLFLIYITRRIYSSKALPSILITFIFMGIALFFLKPHIKF